MGPNIIFAAGALLIFGIFLSSSNRLMTANTQIAEQNEYYLTALSLGQSIIDEAKTKAFDQRTIGRMFQLTSRDSMTHPKFLGTENTFDSLKGLDALTPAGYRSTNRFNDVDDYNGYVRLANTPRAEGYHLETTVTYASENSADSLSGIQTFCKRMRVVVKNPYMPDSLTLWYAFTY